MCCRLVVLLALALCTLSPAYAEVLNFDGVITQPQTAPPPVDIGIALDYETPEVPPGPREALYTQGFAFGGRTEGVTPPVKIGFGIITNPAICLTVGATCADNGTRTLAFDIAASMTRQDFSAFSISSFSASQAYEDDTVCPQCGDGVGLQNVEILRVWGFRGATLVAQESFEVSFRFEEFRLTDPNWSSVDRVVFQPLDEAGMPGTADVNPCCTVVLDNIEVDAEPAAPQISAGGVVLANLTPTVRTIAPLSIISVFGRDLATETVLAPTLDAIGKVATMLAGTCLEMNGERLPLFAVTPGQINAQASAARTFGPASFTVITNCDTAAALRETVVFPSAVSGTETATVEAAAPGFFLFPPLANDGPIAARFNSDNAAVAPAGMFEDQFGPSRPARPGDVIVLYGTGWGATTANLAAGELAAGAATLLPEANPSVSFGGVVLDPGDVFYVGVTPQAAGLYQLAIRVPAGAQPGLNPVVLTVYGRSTPQGPGVPVAAR